MFRKTLILGAVALVASIGSAQAGGLFGCKGSGSLFRGSVGCAIAPVQKQVLTPMVQTAVKEGATAVGGYLGGAPGAAIGGWAGDTINNTAAGGGRFKAVRPDAHEFSQRAERQFAEQEMVFGNFCATPYGIVGPGPMNPVGTYCTGFVHGLGDVPGQVTN